MDRHLARFIQSNEIDQISTRIAEQQHLHPHRALGEALRRAQVTSGYCLAAAEQAVIFLGLDPQRQIGRLQRTEIVQLARAIYRHWQQALGNTQTSSPLQYT